ncbi:hypothetical protein Bbelb_206700 [Branchiostoma belcheri]|nr:hypothetical protein Bbelb_206700 [Branchiostoma belcheri]
MRYRLAADRRARLGTQLTTEGETARGLSRHHGSPTTNSPPPHSLRRWLETDLTPNYRVPIRFFNLRHMSLGCASTASPALPQAQVYMKDFIAEYDGKRPVILTDVVPDWAASTWSRDFFLENYANDSAVVKTVDVRPLGFCYFFGAVPWYGVHGNGSISSAATTLADFAAKSSRGEPGRWMYLEDELFIPTRPELRADLGEVEVLGEDFFQLFPKEVQPWDALLLWGSPSSRSPLHIDPYNWTGINAVISGRKKWKLFPPGQDQRLYITPDQRCGFPLDCIKYNSPVDTFSSNNTRQYPDFQEADFAEVVQVAGELLVIPTGWFHQAYNMEETIAVSRQVMNTNSYREVMEEIIKAGNIDRVSLPPNFPQLSPRLQVQTLVDLLPGEILKKGRLLTDAVLGQINGLL